MLAELDRSGTEISCAPMGNHDPFCTGGLDASPDRPILSFGFRNRRLVSLVRRLSKERVKRSRAFIVAAHREAFGEPVLEGATNRHVHTPLVISAHRTISAMVTCTARFGREACDIGIDRQSPEDSAGLLEMFRGLMESARTGREPAPAPP